MAIPYFDAHCDTIWRCMVTEPVADYGETEAERRAYFQAGGSLRKNGGHIDLERSRGFAGRGQFFALYDDVKSLPPDTAWQRCREMHDWFLRELADNEDMAVLCRTGDEANAAVRSGRMAAFLSVEGADLLNCKVENLYTAADWGVRLLNPVWNNANALSGSCAEEPDRGLSAQGRDFVREMERLGVYADVSHLSDPGFWELFRMTERPIVASHSNARALCPHRRNLTDDMFRAICQTGGVAGINQYASFLGEQPTLDTVCDHVFHFMELDPEGTHIALGGDLDGCSRLAVGFTGIESYPSLADRLMERGLTQENIQNIFWNNPFRVLQTVQHNT